MSQITNTFEYDDIEVNGKSWWVTGVGYADYSYTSGCMYMRNGDPGYPDEEDFEVTDVDIERASYYSEEKDDYIEVDVKDVPQEVINVIMDKLNDDDTWDYESCDEYDPLLKQRIIRDCIL